MRFCFSPTPDTSDGGGLSPTSAKFQRNSDGVFLLLGSRKSPVGFRRRLQPGTEERPMGFCCRLQPNPDVNCSWRLCSKMQPDSEEPPTLLCRGLQPNSAERLLRSRSAAAHSRRSFPAPTATHRSSTSASTRERSAPRGAQCGMPGALCGSSVASQWRAMGQRPARPFLPSPWHLPQPHPPGAVSLPLPSSSSFFLLPSPGEHGGGGRTTTLSPPAPSAAER